MDGRLLIGDEITHINHQSVIDASHRDVIGLMGQAAAHGEVFLGIQRKMPMPETLSPTSGVTGATFPGGDRVGFEVKRDLGGAGGSPPQEELLQVPQGMREVVIERPNTQTSFGFVLQSNTLRPGCMICKSLSLSVSQA